MVKETTATKLIRDNWIGQVERYEIAANASRRFVKELELVTSELDKPLLDKITEIHDNDKLISQQQTHLAKQTQNLGRTTGQLQQMADQALNRIKETGDVQNWAEMLDEDLRVLEQTIRVTSNR